MTGDIFGGSNLIYSFFIAANLTVGDPIYSGASILVDDTFTMTFAGAPREVNHFLSPDGLFEAYWDKATGLMTKLNALFLFAWYNYTIKSTDAWMPALLPPISPPRLTVKLSGDFDYSDKEAIKVRLAALVEDANTLKTVSGATVDIAIYDPDGTLWISSKMLEKASTSGKAARTLIR